MKCRQCKAIYEPTTQFFYKTGTDADGKAVLDKTCICCRTLNQRRRYAAVRERREREAAKHRRKDQGRVVFIHALATGLVYICVTDNIRRTLIYLRDLNADKLVVLFSVPGGEMRLSQIHADLKGRRVHGEWYNPDAEFWYYVDDLKHNRVY